MINGIILLFLAYLNPNFELKTTFVDNVYLNSGSSADIEIIKDSKDFKKISNFYGSELKLPKTYFVDELLLLKKLSSDDDPATFTIASTSKDKNGNYKIFYTVGNKDRTNETKPASKDPYVILKLKPVANKKAGIELVRLNKENPVFVDQSIENRPEYTNVQTQPRELIFHDYFPLDKGNSWTYIFDNSKTKTKITSNIVSFTKGWSVFDNFFGKERVAFQLDIEGDLMTSSKEGMKSFYNETVNIGKSGESFSVEAGTFSDLLIVSIPKNEDFWFKDIYAKGVGLIYHEHHSPKGSSYYHLEKAKVRGKNIP